MIIEEKIKCKGCKCEKPDVEYDIISHSPTWFGKYECLKLVEFVCAKCWMKGVRYD